jgi:TonB family protein
MIAVRCRSLLATIALLAVSTVAAASDEALARAKDLYRTAAYDEALVVLDQIALESSGSARVEASEYRLFCLIALERKSDARIAIEAMVNADPFYTLSTPQAAPRVRTMFKDIRQSLLPGIVQREYAAAKAAFDRQDAEAGNQFDRVLKLLDDPLLPPAPALADLRTVASGFRDLSKARAPKVEFAAATAPTPAEPQPAAGPSNVPSAAAPTTAASQSAAAPVARPQPTVYRDGDADVVPPVTINQNLPQWVVPQGTRPAAWQPEAVIEITIDESGKVANVLMRKSFHPSYDAQLIRAARAWKYEPATKDGVPVRFVKMVSVRLGGVN